MSDSQFRVTHQSFDNFKKRARSQLEKSSRIVSGAPKQLQF